MSKFTLTALLLWGAFLVLIGTFGGNQGITVSASAAGVTATLIFMYGVYQLSK